MKRILKNLINTEVLESYYISCAHKSADGKDCVDVKLIEKIMLLEIYKTICKGKKR